LLPIGTVPWYLDFLAKIVGTILRTKGNDLPYWTRFLVRFWGRKKLYLFIYTSVADPDSESNAFLTPGSGSGMNNPDHISQSLETIFWVKILKFFDADPWWKKIGSGINIPESDTQHWFAHK
jgi:hypothetical protein